MISNPSGKGTSSLPRYSPKTILAIYPDRSHVKNCVQSWLGGTGKWSSLQPVSSSSFVLSPTSRKT